MAEYIERETLLDRIRGTGYAEPIKSNLLVMAVTIPAADVRPVVRGKWIDHQEGRWIYAKCSECGTVHDVRSNFCPNCGAAMGGT